jgi:hypothetical protein
MEKMVKPVCIQDDVAPDSLSYFKKQCSKLGCNFDQIKLKEFVKTSEPDEVVYVNKDFLLYQDAYDQVWFLYKVSDIKKTKSHLNRFV